MPAIQTRLMTWICLASLTGCAAGGPAGPATGDVIQLTSAQAALLVNRIAQFSFTDPSLGALSDTVQLVINAGAEAQRIEVTTDLGGGPFWGVALHRAQPRPTESWSTFHVIAFNDPSNPTQFIILGGWRQESGATAPASVSGPIGGAASISLTGHLFSVSGNQLSAWHASGGTISFTATPSQDACPGFNTQGMTCVKSSMTVSFNISSTVAGAGTTGQRTGSAPSSSVPGIRLSM